MAQGLLITTAHGTTRLKWHRLRRAMSDVPFTSTRLQEGLALGASVEVDLQPHGGEAGFAVLHDDTLERETTGQGLVRNADRAYLKTLSLRASDGEPTQMPILFLDDLARLSSNENSHAGAVVQLDLKVDAAAMSKVHLTHFAEIIAPVAKHFILSCGDAAALALFSKMVPHLQLGFDASELVTMQQLQSLNRIEAFANTALNATPNATMIYLYYKIILACLEQDFDIVAWLRERGKTVDAWTLNSDQEDAANSLHRLLATGVYQITTDEPLALELLATTSSQAIIQGWDAKTALPELGRAANGLAIKSSLA